MPKHPNTYKSTVISRIGQALCGKSSDDSISLASFYPHAEIDIESVEVLEEEVHIYAHGALDHGICPYCGSVSHRVHSRYFRTVTDLPVLGKRTVLHLWMRKFFCPNEGCNYKTFAEQPGNEIFRYRRRSRRCEVTVSRMGLTESAGTARRNISFMNIPLSRATILRDIHRMPLPVYPDVDQIGVDDWAFRKGFTYGSVIVNLRTGMIIDLLGDREVESFRDWLDRHLRVLLVSRDRSTGYSAAVASTKRFINEVADHFHLVKNASDMITRIVSEKYEDYRELVSGERKANGTSQGTNVLRQAKFDQVKQLQAKGMSKGEIVKATGIFYTTVQTYMEMDVLPARKSNEHTDFSMCESYVEQEYAKGRTLANIFPDINKDGRYKSTGPYYHHFHYLSDSHRGPRKAEEQAKLAERVAEVSHKEPLLTINAISSIMERSMRGKELNGQESSLISKLMSLDWFSTIYNAASEFIDLLKSNNTKRLDAWIETYEHTTITRLQRFVYGVKMDIKAIKNCILYPISNGIVEGFVNKIKEVKRVMFGRASLELLKRKLILEPMLFN